MKKIMHKTAAAALLCLLASCDSFLSKEPFAELGADTYFTNEKSLQLYADGFLQEMMPSAETLFRGDCWSDLVATSSSTDYLTVPWSSSRQTGWSYSNWYDLFNVNYFLKHMYEVSGVREETLKHYEGVARFWRAWFYYNKVRTFGAVPWYDEPIDAEDDAALYKARDSREYVMRKVLEDLDFAGTYCSAASAYTQTAQIDKWKALAFKSRVCLFEGTYRKYHTVDPSTGQPWTSDESEVYLRACADACEELMSDGPYSLVSTPSGVQTQYRSLFISEELNRQEIIWGREYSTSLGIYHTATWVFTSPTQSRWSMTRALADMYLNLDGSRFTDRENHDELPFVDETAGRDYRMMQSIVTPGYMKEVAGEKVHTAPDMSVSLTGYQLIKWCFDDDLHSGTRSNNSLSILRYAEVLLNYAEAMAELNGGILEPSVWERTIKPLRERAGVVGTQPLTADPYLASYYKVQSKDLLEIRRERAVELLLENLRYDDLMRWHEGELTKRVWQGIYIPAVGTPIDLNGDGQNDLCVVDSDAGSENGVYYIDLRDGSYTLTGGTSGLLQYNLDRIWEEKMYLRPIPRTATGINPALGQNYGWSD
ncbi:RagB/SusD family nutrient uptake outer membrane protein [uncultured Alistipes sp.]|jgi:hypothetical protein|uniref:RagB/SusD family nutrient uptake outer membrane protein n=1 Tax=uncultured Alistipes sp. TaxID=538949 RepID=UPI0025DA31E9|nr:RagB/SusD family nutrient uptake outer membrane protein [uncultured Alistipes sp.]